MTMLLNLSSFLVRRTQRHRSSGASWLTRAGFHSYLPCPFCLMRGDLIKSTAQVQFPVSPFPGLAWRVPRIFPGTSGSLKV